MSQTAVNDLGGASSPAALVVTSCAIALTLLFFAKFFHNLPEPVLAAIVLMAATHLVRIDDLRKLRLASRPEFRIALLAFFGVLFFGLLDGLLLAAAGSLVMLIAHAARPSVTLLGREPLTGEFVNRARYPGARDPLGAIVIRSPGAWLYFNAEHIRRSILDMVDKAPDGTRLLVIDCSIVPRIDTTAGTTLRVLARSLKARGIRIVLAGLRDDVLENLKAVEAEQDLGAIAPRRSIEDCLKQTQRSDT
jgi:MFS superfamily sulfate permease-like transporter